MSNTKVMSGPRQSSKADAARLHQTYRLLNGIRRIIQASDRYSRFLADSCDITLPQLVALQAVVAEEGLSTRDIAQRVHVSSSTLVGVIDRLESKGFIVRQRDANDRRLIHIVPTEKGRRFAVTAPTPLGAGFEVAFEALSDSRAQTLVRAIEGLADMITADSTARP